MNEPNDKMWTRADVERFIRDACLGDAVNACIFLKAALVAALDREKHLSLMLQKAMEKRRIKV